MISDANTNSAGQYVFAGVNSSQAPLANYFASPSSSAKTAIDQAFESAFGCAPTDPAASAITASQLDGFLSGPFASLFSGAAWTSNWSSASSTNVTSSIAPGRGVETSTNTNTGGFQQLAQGYAMLSEFAGGDLSASAQQELAATALGAINNGVSAITATQANLGAVQSQIKQANDEMNSQMTILQTQIGNLDDVNASAVATQLNTLTTQIETAYQLTAQLQKLSLAQYIPT